MRELAAERKNTAAGFAAVFSNKERNFDGESVLCIGRVSSLLMYISYHRFFILQIFAELYSCYRLAGKTAAIDDTASYARVYQMWMGFPTPRTLLQPLCPTDNLKSWPRFPRPSMMIPLYMHWPRLTGTCLQ